MHNKYRHNPALSLEQACHDRHRAFPAEAKVAKGVCPAAFLTLCYFSVLTTACVHAAVNSCPTWSASLAPVMLPRCASRANPCRPGKLAQVRAATDLIYIGLPPKELR